MSAKKTGLKKRPTSMISKLLANKQLKRSRFSRQQLGVFAAVFALIGSYFVIHSFAASTATITVTNTTNGTIQTQLSTNIVPYYPLNTVAGAQAKFNSLHPP